MIFSAQEIKNELILGLDGGARIPAPLLTTRIDKAMIRIFDTTAIMKLPRYFDETSGDKLLERRANENDFLQKELNKVPYTIYIA